MATFSKALKKVKEGRLVRRSGWNGKGMYILLIKGCAVTGSINNRYGNPNGEKIPVLDAIYMKTADNKLAPWLPSQTDMLASDWEII